MRGLTIGLLAVGLSVGGGLMLSQAHSFAVDFTYLTLGPSPERAPELAKPAEPVASAVPAAATAPVVVSQIPRLPEPGLKDTVVLTSLSDMSDRAGPDADEADGETSVSPIARRTHTPAPVTRSVSTRGLAPQQDAPVVKNADAYEVAPRHNNAVPRYLIGVYR